VLGDATGSAELALRIGPALVVHVVDQTGAAVVSARVSKLDNLDAFTDRDGKVTFRGPPGHAYVSVVAPGQASSSLSLTLDDDRGTRWTGGSCWARPHRSAAS
jgi:hypothetical protein